MTKEFEAHVLDIDVEDIKKKLRDLGAEEEPEVLMKRWVFGMGVEYDWIRLRHNGKNTTLAHKKKTGQDISETEEIEVIVDDFDKTAEILSKIGFKNSYYQENKRHFFKLNAIEFCIDTWPKIPSHLEVESFSEEKVLEGLRLLGLEGKDSGNLSIKDIYLKYGIDLHSFNAIKFDL